MLSPYIGEIIPVKGGDVHVIVYETREPISAPAQRWKVSIARNWAAGDGTPPPFPGWLYEDGIRCGQHFCHGS